MAAFPTIPDWVALEHQVAQILTEQEIHGWYFDEAAAWELASSLGAELHDLGKTLRGLHPYVEGAEFTPKRPNKTQGYITGATFTRLKELNPTSRDHIAWILKTHYGWKPSQMTATGKPMIDEIILKEIGTPIATMFARCLDITKKLGMISEGINAWLKLSTSASRIHHHCSVATNTHRCAHRKPNLGQVPSDLEYRRLFTASPNMVLVGADLSGIELRMLAHYLARYDGGRYGDILLNGDIHQVNADKIGISRREVKTVTYAFLYGAGNEKIGTSYDSSLSSSAAKSKGKEIREAFVDAIDGLGSLLDAIKHKAECGHVRLVDGRSIAVESPHKALNYLLQGSAGVIAKRWMAINQDTIESIGIEAHQLAFIHDELQFETTPTNVNDLQTSLVCSAAAAGEYYQLRCPIEAEAKTGNPWADVH